MEEQNQPQLSEHEVKPPLRKCRECSLEAYTKEVLELFVKSKVCKHGRQNKCKKCNREERQRARNNDPHLGKNSRYLRLYGISYNDVKKIQQKQKNVCAICGTSEPKGNGKAFHVDHNHSTNEVRGLLCGACNIGLGLFNDSPEQLQKAIKYLEERGHYGRSKN